MTLKHKPVLSTHETLVALARELVDRYTKRQPVAERHNGCGWCGGLPHSTECLVGRMEAALIANTEPSRNMREWISDLHAYADQGMGTYLDADECRELAALLVGVEPRLFPIQDGPAIPWDVIAPFEAQCQRNHSQSVARLAQRGGLGVGEAIPILLAEDYWKYWQGRGGYDRAKKADYINELLALVRQRQQQMGLPHD